jgi:hypothetical protein
MDEMSPRELKTRIDLANSVRIPLEEIEFRTDHYLRQLGFKNVKNVAGGLDDWARTGDPGMRRY